MHVQVEARRVVRTPVLGSRALPTLIRLVIMLGGLAALTYGAMLLLATQVKIAPHEITESVDLPKAPK